MNAPQHKQHPPAHSAKPKRSIRRRLVQLLLLTCAALTQPAQAINQDECEDYAKWNISKIKEPSWKNARADCTTAWVTVDIDNAGNSESNLYFWSISLAVAADVNDTVLGEMTYTRKLEGRGHTKSGVVDPWTTFEQADFTGQKGEPRSVTCRSVNPKDPCTKMDVRIRVTNSKAHVESYYNANKERSKTRRAHVSAEITKN